MVRGKGASSALADQDAEALLAEFSAARTDEAFAEVVRRYAAMVFAVCLRVCGNAHDAEDATQAAFLTLAVQCKSGKPVKRLGPWLKQVATRAALDVRRARKRRDTHEQRHATQRTHEVEKIHREQGRNGAAVPAASSSDLDLEKLTRVMGEEIAKLPPRYRLPLVCIYYSGMSRQDVAKELGCTLGTLGVRVHRGRQMLARNLATRGLAPPGGMLSAGLLAAAAESVGRGVLLERAASAAGHAVLGHDLAAAVTQGLAATLKATGAAAIVAKLKGAAVVGLIVGISAVAAGAATRDWETLAPQMPGVVRSVADWVRALREWKLPVPKLRGTSPATPLAASHAPGRMQDAEPQAAVRPTDGHTWTDPLIPARGMPVTFSDERRTPRATPTTLVDWRVDHLPAGPLPLRTHPAIYLTDDRSSVATLSVAMRSDLAWTGSAASAAMTQAATPEPSALGLGLVAGGWFLLRRGRRRAAGAAVTHPPSPAASTQRPGAQSPGAACSR